MTTTAVPAWQTWLLQQHGANDLGGVVHVASHAYTSCTASSNSDHQLSRVRPHYFFFFPGLTFLWGTRTLVVMDRPFLIVSLRLLGIQLQQVTVGLLHVPLMLTTVRAS